MTSLPQRRSSRRQTPIKSTGALSHWRRLSSLWRQQFIDLGHGRISRCTRRLVDATDSQRQELREMELSFVALAITSGASSTLYPQYLLMNILSDIVLLSLFLGVNYTAMRDASNQCLCSRSQVPGGGKTDLERLQHLNMHTIG